MNRSGKYESRHRIEVVITGAKAPLIIEITEPMTWEKAREEARKLALRAQKKFGADLIFTTIALDDEGGRNI